MSTMLFLCTGNYYRSRFAEIVFNYSARRRGLSWQADSRGLELSPNNPGAISFHTRDALAARRIRLPEPLRLPLPLTLPDLTAATHIVAVKEAEHRRLLDEQFPQWTSRVEFWHVHDIDCARPDVALPQLEREVERLLDRLAACA